MNRFLKTSLAMLIVMNSAIPAGAEFVQKDYFALTAEITFMSSSVPGDPIATETMYIISCQDYAKGCINDVVPSAGPTWVVPRENGTAIIGLVEAYTASGSAAQNNEFVKSIVLKTADYLKNRQEADGGWSFHYDEVAGIRKDPSKSPSTAGSVVMAMYRLMQAGFEDPSHQYYDSAKKGAQFIMACVDHKTDRGGTANGLAGGGKEYGSDPADYPLHDDDGMGYYRWGNWSWVSDNSYAYLALMCMKDWAAQKGEAAFSSTCGNYAAGILNGINAKLKNTNNAVWYRVVNENGDPVADSTMTDALCYYPQKLDLPVETPASYAGDTARWQNEIARWMTDNLQKNDCSIATGKGAFRWGDCDPNSATRPFTSDRLSQGFSMEAWLALVDIPGDVALNSRNNAKNWWEAAEGTGGNGQLWDVVNGGIVDWYDPNGISTQKQADGEDPLAYRAAPSEKFIDSSANCIFVYKGGVNFNFPLDSQILSIAHNGLATALPSEKVVITTGTISLAANTNTLLAGRAPRKAVDLKTVSFYYYNDTETRVSTATVRVPASVPVFGFRFEVPVDFSKAKYFYYCIESVDSRGFRTYWPRANSREFYRVDIEALAVANVNTGGGTVTLNDGNPNDGTTSLDIPPGALDSSVNISIEEVPSNDNTLAGGGSITGNARPLAVYRFLPEGLVFNRSVTMNLLFRDLDQDGFVDGTPYRENTLRIFWWDGVEWRLVGGEVNTVTNVVSTKLKHFSMYAVFPAGSLVDNDYRPKERIITPATVDTRNDFASFSGIDDIDVITIYDINGKRIRQLRDAYTWDGRDDSNAMVESGLYIYQIKLKTTGKIISGTIAVAK